MYIGFLIFKPLCIISYITVNIFHLHILRIYHFINNTLNLKTWVICIIYYPNSKVQTYYFIKYHQLFSFQISLIYRIPCFPTQKCTIYILYCARLRSKYIVFLIQGYIILNHKPSSIQCTFSAYLSFIQKLFYIMYFLDLIVLHNYY